MIKNDKMAEEKVRVLFIAGASRSGSTILHNILGQVDGFVAVGELRDLWQRGMINNWLCGCGVPFEQCEFWRSIFARVSAGDAPIDAEEMGSMIESFRIKSLPLTWIPALRRRRLGRLQPYLAKLGDVYAAIRDSTGSRVIVDSSKNPAYGYLLDQIPALEVFYLHLIRDAPAVAHSWVRKKMFEPGRPMPPQSHLKSALQWEARNLATELFLPAGQRRLRIRYEDMMIDPHGTTCQIMRWLGQSESLLPFTSSHAVTFDRPNHSVFGNAVRFQRGPVTLAYDDRWSWEMDHHKVQFVGAVTWPLRRRYGYTIKSKIHVRKER